MQARWRFCVQIAVGVICFAPLVLRADEKEIDFHYDPVDHWGSIGLSGILSIGIVILLYSLIRYRGEVQGGVPWGLLVVGIALIPGVVFSFGTILVFERAEKVEFCESCHLSMQGHINDMRDPKSESLAAVHYKNRYIPSNQCYECHTSYGVNGTVEAKISGTVDLYKYYTRTFHKPIKMREPYPNGDCLKCHAQALKWLKQHEDFKAALFKGETRCLECHGAEHPAHTVKE